MKRKISLAVFFILALTFVSTAAAQEVVAIISEMTGTMELKPAGFTDWVPAKAGDRIEKSTIVSTGFRSMAILTVGSSTLTIHALTRLSLEELISNNQSETININLNAGRLRVDVNPPAGSRADFTINTPSAVASVRGTSFVIDLDSIFVLEGAVSFAAPGGFNARPVIVSADQESWVEPDPDRVLHPIDAAEAKRRLPALPGEIGGTNFFDSPAFIESLQGSLELEIQLISQ